MMKDYIFHYNGDMKGLTYHEHLMMEDGKHCRADLSQYSLFPVEAYFDDGNKLTVWITELEEV